MTSKIESDNYKVLTCDTFEDRVHQVLDDRLSLTADAQLMRHAERCRQCEARLRVYDSFSESLGMLGHDVVDANIFNARDNARTLYRPLAGLVSVAAALLIFLSIFGGQSANQSGHDKFAQHLEGTQNSSLVNPAMLGPLTMTQPISAAQLKDVSSNINLASLDNSKLSSFNPIFQVVDSIPQLPSAPDWNSVAKPLEALQPVLTYSAELPGVMTVHCTLNVTIELLRQSLS